MTSSDTANREINFDKFMDAELTQRRQRPTTSEQDTPLRALERQKRRSPADVTVIG